MDENIEQQIRDNLHTATLGREIIYLPTTASTNDVAKQAALDDRPEGVVVLAEQQTRGRGRLERVWYAPAGGSILMSLLLRPSIPAARIFTLTMLAGSAASAAIERHTGLRCDLKWPNDLLIDNRKVGGILTEVGFGGNAISFAVVGLGLNVNVEFADDPLLAATATSLSLQLGRTVPRVPLILSVLEEIERRYEAVKRGEYQAIHDEWRARLATLGKMVMVTNGQSSETGLAVDVDPDGVLLLRTADGGLRRVITGDVSLREARSPAK
ncbi:MAG: biotin--[acetyl-CoA-carboxylase] ligase [Chloroflexi bacterium]|nr:biotin--[acetyl-CoA-carboxylase] ligase [Chloroflexota bacterium]